MIFKNRQLYIFGFLSWLIPFIAALPFFSPEGEVIIDEFLFKSIMIVVFGGLGTALMVRLFRQVQESPLMNGLIIGTTWFLLNIVLDLIVLVGLLGNDPLEWFTGTGLRYLIIVVTGAAIGKAVENARVVQLSS